MDDDNTIIENYDTSDEVEWTEDEVASSKNSWSESGYSEELRKSSPPSSAGQWLWVFGWLVVILTAVAAMVLQSWEILICGFCFSAIFFGLDAVIAKLDELLYEVRRK
jgi:hypothetical protein